LEAANSSKELRMSAYAAIDPILTAWARQKGVHVFTHYRDDEIRSVAIYGPDDDEGGLGISRIDEHGMVAVLAAARNGFRKDRLVPLSELADVLTEMYDELAQHVASWKGRNPYA
jgi:hypothetical protein